MLGLEYSFVDKNKIIKTFLAADMETIADKVEANVDHQNIPEDFQEFMRGYTDIFTKNIYITKEYTLYNLHQIINKDLAVVKSDKD